METRTDIAILVFEDGGGMSQYARNLAQSLQPYGRVELVAIAGEDGLSEPGFFARWLESFHVGRRLRRIYNPWRFRRIARELCRRRNPRVVHVASGIPCLGTLVRELRLHGVSCVHTIHDPEPHPQARSRRRELQLWISQRLLWPDVLKQFDALHVHSPRHRRTLTAAYPVLESRRIYVVQHGGGVSTAIEHGKNTPAELALDGERERTALFFGRIEYYKGLDVLFDAMARLAARVPDCRLIVAGAGRVPPIPEGIRNRIVLINRFIDDEEIASIFAAASVVILPYRSGTQTGVIPLASSFSLPAIVTRVGALDEIVRDGETGFVLDNANSRTLAAAIEKLLLFPERAKVMGEAARNFMAETYAWSVVARQHWDYYGRVHGGSHLNL